MLPQRQEENWESTQVRVKSKTVKRNLKIQPTEKNLNNALRSRCIVLFVMVTALAVFFILRSGVAASSAYNLSQMKSQVSRLEMENARLHLDIAHLKSPERIQAIATQELGMILPDKFFFSTKK